MQRGLSVLMELHLLNFQGITHSHQEYPKELSLSQMEHLLMKSLSSVQFMAQMLKCQGISSLKKGT